MIRRMPIYAHYMAGLPGGIGNPLGARALYLYRGNQDTDFRLHGTNEPETIGTKVSSGCIRLFNHDIIDLYNRAPVGTPVVVLQEGESLRAEAGPETDGYYDRYEPEPPGPYPGPPALTMSRRCGGQGDPPGSPGLVSRTAALAESDIAAVVIRFLAILSVQDAP